MTTPTTVLGLSHIQTEFGGSNPIAISEYYGVNANVPASGTIQMSKFLGISSGSAQVLAKFLSDFGTYSANAQSIHRANGQWTGIASTGGSNYNWLLSGAASAYDVRATLIAGGSSTPAWSAGWANNTWANLATERRVWMRNTSIGVLDAFVSISIRWTANGTVIMTATHQLSAEALK